MSRESVRRVSEGDSILITGEYLGFDGALLQDAVSCIARKDFDPFEVTEKWRVARTVSDTYREFLPWLIAEGYLMVEECSLWNIQYGLFYPNAVTDNVYDHEHTEE